MKNPSKIFNLMRTENLAIASFAGLAVLVAAIGGAVIFYGDQAKAAISKVSSGGEGSAALVKVAVKTADPSADIFRLRAAPMQGWTEVSLTTGEGQDQLIYVANDGGQMIVGNVIDVAAKKSLTFEAVNKARVELVAKAPADARITFKAPDERRVLYAFTDTDCDACKVMHDAIGTLNSAGVTVHYLPFPRGDLGGKGFGELSTALCSKEPTKTFTAAIAGDIEVTPECAQKVLDGYRLGTRLAVEGVPTLVLDDGRQLPGFPDAAKVLAEMGLAVPASVTGS